MKKNYLSFILLICALNFGFGQTTIGIQDFETSPATPTMTYTGGSIATGTGPFPAGDNNFVSGSRAIEVNNGTETVLFSSVNTIGYTNVYFTCRLASFSGSSGNGADGSDIVYFEISDDNGATWSSEIEVEGNSNARWSFDTGTGTASTTYDGDNSATIFTPAGGGNRTTDGYSTITITDLPNVANLRVRLIMNNDAANEYWIVDDAEVIGTPTATSDLAITGSTDHGSSCIGVAASTIQYTITNNSAVTTALNVAAVSDNPQFVVSNLIPTTIAPSGTATFDVIFTPTATGAQSAIITVSSTTITDDAAITLTGTGITLPTVGTQPTNQAEDIPNTATFTVASSDASSYQWQVSTNGGTTWTNVTGGTGATTDTYTTGATDETMNGNLYRCVLTNTCGSTNSNSASLTLTNSNPNNAQNLTGCFDDTSVVLTWNNPATPPTGGYVIFAIEGTTDPTSPPNDATTYTANANFAAAPFETPASLGKVVYKGTGNTATVTGLTEDSTYSFRIFAYNGETLTGWANGTSAGSNEENIAQDDVRNLTATPTSSQVTLDWTNPTPLACWDQLIIVANQGAVTFTPTGDGSTYSGADNDTYAAANQLVYETTSNVNTKSVFGLTNDTGYCFKVFIRRGTTWSDGVEVCATPVLTYCDAGPTSNLDSEIENVTLVGENDTISNDTTDDCTGGTGGVINDYTAMSADLFVGGTYTLTVEYGDCNNGTQYDGAGGVWIDWNNDGDFDDVSENISAVDVAVGTANVVESITINVPVAQPIGTYRMRIVQEEGGSAGTVSPCGTFNWGSVEDYTIEVIAACTPTQTVSSFTPTSGPELTEVIINGTGFTAGTAVEFSGINATIISQSATQLVVEVPIGATTGSITITEAGCPLDSSTFTVLDSTGSCSTSSFTDIIISEVYDSNGGNVWYMELYNPTNTAINLDAAGTDFALERYATIGDATPSRTIDLTGTIAANSTFTIRCGDASPNPCSSISYDLTVYGAGINEQDEIRLTKNGAQHDVVHCPNEIGYSIYRDNTSVGPSITYSASDWSNVSAETCSDIGIFSVPATLPLVSTLTDITDCSISSFSISATPGNSGVLTYQWLYNDGTSANWSNVTTAAFAPGTVTGETSDTLTITGFNLDGYQFYCEVTEDATCSIFSNAAQYNVGTATWDGTNWIWSDNTAIDTPPTTADRVTIDADYDTATGGVEISFEACDCTVNTGNTLTIADDDYVLVQNNVVNNGTIDIATSGALVQVDDAGTYTLNPTTGTNILSKTTSFLDNWYDYTYWSSPLVNAQIETALFNSNPQRRYFFNAAQYNDILVETNNTGTFTNGNDDIDDEGNDWTAQITGLMTPGRGYASMHTNLAFTPNNYTYYFEGNPSNSQGGFNTGNINADIYIRPEVLPVTSVQNYNNWNFIGNPYPSAIDATIFFEDTSSFLEGVIYLWSHVSNADFNASGNENANFSQDDYAMLNYTGGITTGSAAPNDPGNIPDGYTGSAQGFFVIGNKSHATSGAGYYNEVVFNNRMRVTGNNTQFYRTSNQSNKLWVNLTSDTGIFSQVLIGYVEGATDGVDAMSFDAPRNLSTGTSAILSSVILNSDKKYAIQAKDPDSLSLDEIIPLGFYSNTSEPTTYTLSIAQLEGDFLTTNTIYLIDNLNNTIHNLSDSNYAFTSENGDFNERFEIVFNPQTLSINNNVITANDLIITELNNGEVQIKVSEQYTIQHVEILDVLGRQVYSLTGNSSVEVYNLSKLSNTAYIAKVTLSNGQVISKKAIKQR